MCYLGCINSFLLGSSVIVHELAAHSWPNKQQTKMSKTRSCSQSSPNLEILMRKTSLSLSLYLVSLNKRFKTKKSFPRKKRKSKA